MEMKQRTSEERIPQPRPMKAKILVERSFGNGNFMELFTDYVAGKIRSNTVESVKNDKEMTA